eukprot:CAMPEP_0202424094 /NCGR_PEP_ID=MMETSP1128-20130828/51724_1 /ASSEMBLY_ACC=CAM_ASM_000463 /TAXON_ID=3047 /ORGANISM="Dunaliella tertiolecta, Strain CCMP1320" /LENGTH=38 /DNA_ID= /DNA_START= /DNA_END= /DNA_ORIENTATION=
MEPLCETRAALGQTALSMSSCVWRENATASNASRNASV